MSCRKLTTNEILLKSGKNQILNRISICSEGSAEITATRMVVVSVTKHFLS